VTSIDSLARTAYEAHRGAHSGSLPPWEDTTEPEQQAWRAAVSAVAGQTGVTLTDAVPPQSLVIKAGDEDHIFHANFTAGRRARSSSTTLPARPPPPSRSPATCGTSKTRSTNGTWPNGRRIHAAQLLKKGDKIRSGTS
jgi:hypothetical protein